VITPVLDRDGLAEAREISNQHWMIGATLSSTFHGRDIFSPAAAHLRPAGNLIWLGRGAAVGTAVAKNFGKVRQRH